MLFDRSLYEKKDLQSSFIAGSHTGADHDPAAMSQWAQDIQPKYERWSKAQDWSRAILEEPLFVEADMRSAFLQGFRNGQQQEASLEEIRKQFKEWFNSNYNNEEQ